MPPISQWHRLPAFLFFKREDERIYAVVRMAFAAVALLNLLCLVQVGERSRQIVLLL